MAKVRIPTPLRNYTGGKDEVEVGGMTVGDVLANLDRTYSGITKKILDDRGDIRRFINIFLNDEDVRHRQGVKTEVKTTDVLSIFPAIAGGASIPQELITVQDARSQTEKKSHTIIIDVRELDEWKTGHIPGAMHIPRGSLESKIANTIPDKATPIICHCAAGTRSLLATRTLRQLGYTNVVSMTGGLRAWMEAGFPVERPAAGSDDDRLLKRYARHLAIPEVGAVGQKKLLAAKVLLVGIGGLGCPAAYYLAAAGVGTIGLIDFDAVDESNLQRQILHTTDRVGRPKVDSARQTLAAFNPDIHIETHPVKLTSKNVVDLFKRYDVIVDGSDNFATRYLVNDACVLLKKPNVHGSVYRFEGQVSVFWPGKGPCYRCLYPEPPPADLAPSCAEAGVLGVLPGVIGLLEAVEALKLIVGIGESLVGRLLCYDALRAEFRTLTLQRDPTCAYCADGKLFPGFIDYQEFCHG